MVDRSIGKNRIRVLSGEAGSPRLKFFLARAKKVLLAARPEAESLLS